MVAARSLAVTRVAGRRRWLERALDRVPFLEKELLLLRHLVGAGDVCLDIGAAGGAHLAVLSRLVGPDGHVHGFEPRPASYRVLRAGRRLLRWHNVDLHRFALGADPGVADLRVPVVPTRAHVGGDGPAAHDAFARLPSRTLQVPVTTVDVFVAERGIGRLDLVKCDVEGAEPQILAGAGETLARLRPVVLCEIWGEHLRRYGSQPAEVFAWLAELGYRAYTYRAGTLRAVVAARADEDDYLFLPPGREPPLPLVT